MIKFYTLAHKRPDFIEMQFESMKKHFKFDFEYIVLNNALDSEFLFNEITKICEHLKIQSIPVEIDELNDGAFNWNGYIDASHACYYPLKWLFKKKIDTSSHVCFIDSDIFFIDDINFEKIIENNDLIYMPQYRNDFLYIAPTIVFFNTNTIKNLSEIDWGFYRSGNVVTDVGGNTNDFLTKNNHLKPFFLEQYTLYDFNKTEEEISCHLIINGNINYSIKYNNNNLLKMEHIGGHSMVDSTRSFRHEPQNKNYFDNIFSNFKKIENILFDELSPKPLHLGFLKNLSENNFFAIHYQVGSNYTDFSTNEYNNLKTKLIKKNFLY